MIITYRGKSVAILTPLGAAQLKGLNPVGFGMWRDHRDMRSVDKWLKHARAPRHER